MHSRFVKEDPWVNDGKLQVSRDSFATALHLIASLAVRKQYLACALQY
jgi:hypothetical protein